MGRHLLFRDDHDRDYLLLVMSTAGYTPPYSNGSAGPRKLSHNMIIQDIPARNGGHHSDPDVFRSVAQLDAEINRRIIDFRSRKASVGEARLEHAERKC